MGLLTVDPTTGKDYDTSPTGLADLPWSTLLQMRQQNNGNQAAQDLLGPYEQGAYARENSQSPGAAATMAGLLVPGYQAAKLLGLAKGRTPASMAEFIAGEKGAGQGLLDWWQAQTASPDTAR